MSGPTLLAKGALRTPADEPGAPIAYIVGWLRKRMPEYGGRGGAVADRVLVVRSETGSGKSTVLPVHVFRILRGEHTARRMRYRGPGVICTQPRVLTAVDLAARQVGGSPHYPDMILGETVGYQTGPFSERGAGLLFATVGVLRAQLGVWEDAEVMARYRFIILDEVHEGSQELQTTLMMLKHFYIRNAGNPALPFLLLASATIETARYAAYFGVGEGNIVEVAGRQFPVREHWPRTGTNDYPREAARLAREIHESDEGDDVNGDILIFMPGGAEAKAVAAYLARPPAGAREGKPFLLLKIDRAAVSEDSPHFRWLSAKPTDLPLVDGQRPARRIIVSTAVAETGLTIPTLRHVIDCGWSRAAEVYQPQGVGGLITRPAAQSRILQRLGRVGRLFPGEFHPLYTRATFDALERQQLPDAATMGVTDGILALIAAQQRQKTLAGKRPEFRVEDVDTIGGLPADALHAALEAAQISGFADDDGLTRSGTLATRLSRVGLREARVLLAGLVWGASLSDLATIVAAFGRPLRTLLERRPDAGTASPAAAQRAAVAPFLRFATALMPSVSDGAAAAAGPGAPATGEEAGTLRLRAWLADDFIELLMLFDAFARALESAKGDLAAAAEWCAACSLDAGAMAAFAARRDEVMDDLIAAGLDPWAAASPPLADAADAGALAEAVRRLKLCLHDGLRAHVLAYDKKENTYRDRFGARVEVPTAFTDVALAQLRRLGVELRKPRYLLIDRIVLKLARPSAPSAPQPLLYRATAPLVSALDRFVHPDPAMLRVRPLDGRAASTGEHPAPAAAAEARAHLDAYLRALA